MPLSKARQAEYHGQYRRGVIPNSYLKAHMAAYPEGYNPRLDTYINPMMRQAQLQPKYPLGTMHLTGRTRSNLINARLLNCLRGEDESNKR